MTAALFTHSSWHEYGDFLSVAHDGTFRFTELGITSFSEKFLKCGINISEIRTFAQFREAQLASETRELEEISDWFQQLLSDPLLPEKERKALNRLLNNVATLPSTPSNVVHVNFGKKA